MRRESVLILLGVLVILSPFAGLPSTWLAWLLPLLGVCIIIIGISLRRKRNATGIETRDGDTSTS